MSSSPSSSSPSAPLPLPWALRAFRRMSLPGKLGLGERLFRPSLGSRGVQWVRTAAGPVWKLDLGNPTHRWIVYGDYEGPELWRWLDRAGGSMRAIVDSGANIGQTVLTFAARLPRAGILAFEPGRSAREWLQAGVDANRLSQVEVVAAGLGAASGEARLQDVGNSALHGSWNRIGDQGEAVAITTLDAEVERRGLERVDLWKLDIEGYEIEALRGAERCLRAGRIGAIWMETGIGGEAAPDHLRERGYTAWRLDRAGRASPLEKSDPWGNALFLAPGASVR